MLGMGRDSTIGSNAVTQKLCHLRSRKGRGALTESASAFSFL